MKVYPDLHIRTDMARDALRTLRYPNAHPRLLADALKTLRAWRVQPSNDVRLQKAIDAALLKHP